MRLVLRRWKSRSRFVALASCNRFLSECFQHKPLSIRFAAEICAGYDPRPTHAATLVMSRKFRDPVRKGRLVRWASGCRRSSDSAQQDDCSGHRDAAVFQQHNPARNQPWTTKRAQMPNVVSWDDANGPDDDRHGRGRPRERQEPEQVPGINDRCTQK